MVEGESSNARERRLKMQADLERMNQRMEESDAEGYVYSEEESENERLIEERRTKKRNDPISSESEQGEFEIGAKFGGANSSSIELGVKTRKVVFWSILEHMGHKEHGGTWHMEAAQLDTQRKKGEAILKTSSTRPSTRPAKLQLDRASKSNPKNVALDPKPCI
ncbi:unnamed protein product [Microthlaspi erraticum]|uniref:Uncharacterized protein n=1 Tax=Microthlaspi erraticum TaxID=1685480 RepID=A0A6D2KUG9_9BRAS|nr:unnamed protein product [Microthlaspi erraticum]